MFFILGIIYLLFKIMRREMHTCRCTIQQGTACACFSLCGNTIQLLEQLQNVRFHCEQLLSLCHVEEVPNNSDERFGSVSFRMYVRRYVLHVTRPTWITTNLNAVISTFNY